MKHWAVALLLALLLAGHAAAETGISVVGCVEPDKAYGELVNAPINAFEALLDEWQQAHADVPVSYRTRTLGEINMLARMDRLPDIFMLDARTGRIYAREGLLCEVTDAVVQSEYAEAYRYDALTPYLYYGRIAAFPALTKYCNVVIYDRDVFDAFPSSWDALCAFDARARGYDGVIAFGNDGGTPAVAALLSPLLSTEDGGEWLLSMINGERAHSFRDGVFVDALSHVMDMLDAPVFAPRVLKQSAEAAIGAFADQKTPALLVSGNDVFRALETVKAKSPALYDRLDFATLPGGPAASGFTYGLFVNEKLSDDPDRLRACLDLCVWLTGPRYAETVAACGQQGFTAADPAARAAFLSECDDDTLKRLAAHMDGAETCMDLGQYLYHAVWSAFGGGIAAQEDPDAPNAAIIANDMQDMYEKYYLTP